MRSESIPFSFAEFYFAYDGNDDDAWDDYMIYGGLPQVAGFQSERQMSYTNKTISNHIGYLAEAFLISKASRYDIKGRKYIGANLKDFTQFHLYILNHTSIGESRNISYKDLAQTLIKIKAGKI